MATTTKWLLAGALLCTSLLVYLWWNQGYGQTSSHGYEFATALFAACNQQNTERLETIARQLDEAVAAGHVHEREVDWLRDIIADGRRGDWRSANRAARQLMTDQLEPVVLPSTD